jgi:transposase InsO family protein
MKFQSLLNDKELRQSMSRRGNCWDNAPQESFFGHMKDDMKNLNKINTFSELQIKIDDYMDYYNNDRYQWNLAKLSPNQYAEFIETGVYPLAHLAKTPEIPTVQTPC